MVKYFACVADNFLNAFFRSMGRVHTYDVHAGFKELADKVHAATSVADGGYNLGLFHCLKVPFV